MRALACLVAALLSLPAAPARAAETAAFLKIAPGARPVSLGGAFTALADDLNAFSYNPAGLARLAAREAAFMHAELYADTRYDFVGYAHPMSADLGTLAFGFARLDAGRLEGRGEDRRPTGSFGASDNVLQLAYGRRLGGTGAALGGTFKLLHSAIGDASATGAAFDAGWHYAFSAGGVPATLGLSVLNLGPGLRFGDRSDDLPLSVGAGAAVRLWSGLQLVGDFRHRPRAGRSQFGFGTEYALFPALTLRAGYAAAFQEVAAAGGGLVGMGLGFGLRVGKARVDYSFLPAGELGSAQRVSLSSRF